MSKPIRYSLISLMLLSALGAGLFLIKHSPDAPNMGQLRDRDFYHLMLLSLALSSYESEHHGLLPTMKDPATLKAALINYIVRSNQHESDHYSVLRDLNANEPYWPNPSLSGKSLASYGKAAAWTVAFYTLHPDPRGRHPVAMLDGSLRYISAKDWPRVKQESHLP